MTATTFRWTLKDWHHLVESGVLANKRVELLAGEIINMAPEGIPHSATNRTVADYLRELLKNQAYISEAHPVTLINSEPQPDVAILRLPKDDYLSRHPNANDIYWLIEVSDATLNYDLNDKAEIYAKNGIAEYWIIDLKNKRVVIHTQLSNNKYQTVQEFRQGKIKSLAFPDIEISFEKLLIY